MKLCELCSLWQYLACGGQVEQEKGSVQRFEGGAGQGAHRHIAYGSRNGVVEGARLRGRPLHRAHRLEGQARQGDALGVGGLGHKPVTGLGQLMALRSAQLHPFRRLWFVRRCDCLTGVAGRNRVKKAPGCGILTAVTNEEPLKREEGRVITLSHPAQQAVRPTCHRKAKTACSATGPAPCPSCFLTLL